MKQEDPHANDANEHPTEAEIDEALKATFPASDPLAWTLGIENPSPEPDSEADETPPKKDESR